MMLLSDKGTKLIVYNLRIRPYQKLTDRSIPIHERVELPEELIPADSRVEIDAKITAGMPKRL